MSNLIHLGLSRHRYCDIEADVIVDFSTAAAIPALLDYAEAKKWFQKAADQGDADSQYNLGSLYYDGHGVTQDYA